MVKSLAHRSNIPFMVNIPNDPEALRLLRLLVVLFDFAWRNRVEVLLFIENVNKVFDVIEATLDMCAVCYDGWVWVICTLKYELKTTVLSSI